MNSLLLLSAALDDQNDKPYPGTYTLELYVIRFDNPSIESIIGIAFSFIKIAFRHIESPFIAYMRIDRFVIGIWLLQGFRIRFSILIKNYECSD